MSESVPHFDKVPRAAPRRLALGSDVNAAVEGVVESLRSIPAEHAAERATGTQQWYTVVITGNWTGDATYRVDVYADVHSDYLDPTKNVEDGKIVHADDKLMADAIFKHIPERNAGTHALEVGYTCLARLVGYSGEGRMVLDNSPGASLPTAQYKDDVFKMVSQNQNGWGPITARAI